LNLGQTRDVALLILRAPNGVLNYSANTTGLDPSEKGALEGCEKAAKAPCVAIIKNFGHELTRAVTS
jgi:hypothetical protein